MSNATPLHPSIIALVSLAANIAANHPKKGLCQIERLRGYGVTDAQIDMVVDIARHLRDEAGQMLDAQFNDEAKLAVPPVPQQGFPLVTPTANACCAPSEPTETGAACGCTPTANGNACC
ncbi:MAG: hypothetical protein Q7U32_05475 [Rhodocyclaceae bacterium]|jgi:hypothetical protein|nr:hypothetical protein [Rhodocyclaceae bacterium]